MQRLEKSENLLNLENKNKQLEQKKSSLELDYQNLEQLVEKILGRLEIISNSDGKNSDMLAADESATNIVETDQPKLF